MIQFNDLMQRALIVFNAKLKKENTAKRLGSLFRDILNYNKTEFATKNEIENIISAMMPKGEVANISDLPTTPFDESNAPNGVKTGYSYIVTNDKDPESGLSYIYVAEVKLINGIKTVIWENTKLTAYPKDVATIPEINKIIKNLYSKYDIYTDEYGNVLRYNTEKDNLIEIYNNLHLDSMLITDADGWVSQGWDWKNRQLINLEIQYITPNIYNVQCDESGNVINFQKTWSSQSSGIGSVSNKLSDCFTQEVPIVQGVTHYGFPGICAGKNGVIHAFYRKGLYHTGIDGDVMYSYSKDYGATWSDEIVALAGGDEWDGWFGDWRDAKAIRMSNGKFLLSHSIGYAKENGGQPPYHVDYDISKYKTYGIIYEQLANGTLDIASPKMVELPNTLNYSHLFGAGGLVEHNDVIYITVYGGQPNSCLLYKSIDFGETWQAVSKIADGFNENSIAFIGDTLFCIMRAVDGNARIVKSVDFGETWQYVKDLDTYYHGMYALSLGDTIMIAGRAYDSRTNIVFMEKSGNFVLSPIPFGRQGDSSYADICTFENYVHIIYYAQLSNTNWGIFTRKVERNRVIGLSY